MRDITRGLKRLRLRTLFFAMAAIGMLTMPVEYRAGAEVPHYHIFFQLWIDASNASFRHHEPARAHANGHAQPAGTSTAKLLTTIADDPDAPQLSALLAPETRSVILVSLGGFLITTVAGRRMRPTVALHSLTGRLVGPEPPPPRLAA